MIEAVQAKDYSLAVSIFQRLVRGTRAHFLPENPLGNFYYAVALYLDKSAAAMKKTETILRSKEIYYGYLAAEKIILTAKLGQSALDNCVIGKVDSAPLENTLYYFALKHFHLVKSDDLLEEINSYVKKQLDKGLNLLRLEMSADFDFLKDEQAALEKATGMHPSLPYIKVRGRNRTGQGVRKESHGKHRAHQLSPQPELSLRATSVAEKSRRRHLVVGPQHRNG